MRAKITFTAKAINDDEIKGFLRNKKWWPTDFSPDSLEAKKIISNVENNISIGDLNTFQESNIKFVILNKLSETRGVLSYNKNEEQWIIRIHNYEQVAKVNSIKLGCELFIQDIRKYFDKSDIEFSQQVEIIEPKQNGHITGAEVIFEGEILVTKKDKFIYAKKHRRLEFRISILGAALSMFLLYATYLSFNFFYYYSIINWALSVCDKIIGSVTITTMVSFLQFYSFYQSLGDKSIYWKTK